MFASVALAALTAGAMVNVDFETTDDKGRPVGWRLPADSGWSIVEGEGINGTRALCYDADKKAPKTGCAQQWTTLDDLSKKYLVEAYVRTVGVVGRGATLSLLCHDKNGRQFYGKYSHDEIGGTSDGWKKISTVTGAGQFPPEAVKFTFNLYAGTASGKIYFDNVRLVPYEAVRAEVGGLFCDVYRNEAADGQATFRVALNLDDAVFKTNVPSGFCRFTAADDRLVTRPVAVRSPREAEFTLDVADLALGTHPVSFALRGADGRRIGKSETPFTRLEKPVARRVAFDRYNRTRVDGKPFFPLGMYISRISGLNATNLDVYCQAPFNCILPYAQPESREEFDVCRRRGLMLIASVYKVWAGRRTAWVKSEADEQPYLHRVMSQFRDHPALLAWYIGDELPAAMIPRMAVRQTFMAAEDPDHPTYFCNCNIDEMRDFLPGYDVVGSDPYPIGREQIKALPISLAAEWTRETRMRSLGVRPMWQIPQAFDWAWFGNGENPKFPTHEEFRNMSYQCIAEGANGLIYYSFTQMQRKDKDFAAHWAYVCETVREIAANIPVFTLVPGPAVRNPAPDRLSVRTWRADDGAVWLLAVNDTREPLSAAVGLDAQPASIGRIAFGPSPKLTNASLAFSFAPLESTLVKLSMK